MTPLYQDLGKYVNVIESYAFVVIKTVIEHYAFVVKTVIENYTIAVKTVIENYAFVVKTVIENYAIAVKTVIENYACVAKTCASQCTNCFHKEYDSYDKRASKKIMPIIYMCYPPI